jgi:hypothetical protein
MSVKMTPEEVLNSVTEGINAGDLDSLMTLNEPLACFASQPGQLAKSPDGIRESMRSFIDMNGKLDLRVKTVLKASHLALVTTDSPTELADLLSIILEEQTRSSPIRNKDVRVAERKT